MGMKINAHLPIPADLKAEYPLSSQILKLKEKRDREIREIFEGKSDKFLVIVGPCSADNEDSVCEYVSKLATINEKVSDRLMIIQEFIRISREQQEKDIKECFNQPKPDEAPDLLAGIIAIRKMHIRAIEESGLTGQMRCSIPKIEVILTIFCLMRQSEQDLWKISSIV